MAEETRTRGGSPDDATGPGSGPVEPPDPGADEPGLVEAVQAGDSRAFSLFVTRYTDPAYAVALSILRHEQDAEDAVQAAFIRALERIGLRRTHERGLASKA